MSDFSEQIDRDMGWDEEILEESSYKVLPEGDYDFVVKLFERAIFEPKEGNKIPLCNMARMSIEVNDGKGNVGTVDHKLYLCKSLERKMSEFFVAIGQKKHGEPLKPNWDAVVGAHGKCKVAPTVSGDKTYNNIKKFYDPEEKATSRASTGFTPGKF